MSGDFLTATLSTAALFVSFKAALLQPRSPREEGGNGRRGAVLWLASLGMVACTLLLRARSGDLEADLRASADVAAPALVAGVIFSVWLHSRAKAARGALLGVLPVFAFLFVAVVLQPTSAIGHERLGFLAQIATLAAGGLGAVLIVRLPTPRLFRRTGQAATIHASFGRASSASSDASNDAVP